MSMAQVETKVSTTQNVGEKGKAITSVGSLVSDATKFGIAAALANQASGQEKAAQAADSPSPDASDAITETPLGEIPTKEMQEAAGEVVKETGKEARGEACQRAREGEEGVGEEGRRRGQGVRKDATPT